MMALRIAILMMAVNGSLGWIVSTGILDYSTSVNNVDSATIQAATPELNYSSQTVTTYIFGDFLRILPTLRVIIQSAIILVVQHVSRKQSSILSLRLGWISKEWEIK